jgi:type VI secretion system lysozyme-like protein
MGPGSKRRGLVEGPVRRPGLRLPLLDRLADREPGEEAQPKRVLSRGDIMQSIRAELSRLLNTRCPVQIDALRGQERSVVNFGMPDVLTLNPTSDADRQRLAALIAAAVRAYEPRLRNPVLEVTTDPSQPRALRIVLDATLVLDNLAEPVSFPFTVEERGVYVIDSSPADGELSAVVV